MSAQTGGRELLELSDAWQSPPQEKVVDFRKPLFVLLLLVILFDALITRMGWTLPAFAIRLPSRQEDEDAQSRQAKTSEGNGAGARETDPSRSKRAR